MHPHQPMGEGLPRAGLEGRPDLGSLVGVAGGLT